MEYDTSSEIVTACFSMRSEDAIELLKYCELTGINVYYESFGVRTAVLALKAKEEEVTFLKLLFKTKRW